jgi:hypothetical protein
MAAGFSVTTGAAFAVTSGAKTILNLLVGATNPPILTEYSMSFDGVTATAVPVLVELCASTQAGAGTPGSVGAIQQVRGFPTFTPITTVAGQYSAEPTVLTSFRQWFVPAFMGMADWQMPLGREIQGILTAATALKGIAFRVSAPAAVNARGYAEWEE